jgi:glycerophosphoryl diester phosphodiesterase
LLVIAHRGASALAPENTMASFQRALAAGADMIELDVHLSADNEVMVIHDPTLNRTTNGRGRVRDHSYRELSKLDAGTWFAEKFAGERIPLLAEVLELVQMPTKVNIELKGSPAHYSQLAARVVQTIRNCRAAKQTVVTSFDMDYLKAINKLAPEIQLGEIHYLHFPFKWRHQSKHIASEINPLWLFVTRGFVEKAHSNGMKFNPWTTANRYIVKRLLRLKVDGLITNNPQKLIAQLTAIRRDNGSLAS